MKKCLIRAIPPTVAAIALLCSLNASSYGQFRLPYQEKVEPLWQSWRAQITTDPGHHSQQCKDQPNLKTIRVSAPTWAQIKAKRVGELTPDKLIAQLGNPLCSLPDGTIRYLSNFSDAAIDLKVSKNGINARLTRNPGMAAQPR